MTSCSCGEVHGPSEQSSPLVYQAEDEIRAVRVFFDSGDEALVPTSRGAINAVEGNSSDESGRYTDYIRSSEHNSSNEEEDPDESEQYQE